FSEWIPAPVSSRVMRITRNLWRNDDATMRLMTEAVLGVCSGGGGVESLIGFAGIARTGHLQGRSGRPVSARKEFRIGRRRADPKSPAAARSCGRIERRRQMASFRCRAK